MKISNNFYFFFFFIIYIFSFGSSYISLRCNTLNCTDWLLKLVLYWLIFYGIFKLNSQLACKAPGIEKAHQTTLDILDIMISYPWEAQAVLTLTDFATEYGHIWHLNHYSPLDPLAKSLANIKHIASLKKHLDSPKYRQVLLSPNSLITSCLKVIKYMNELRNFSKYDMKELNELSSTLRQIPLITYWVIHIIVASRTEISSYLNETE